jgi:hypothetical protein
MAKEKHNERVAASGESVIQAEGRAHQGDEGKADKNITPKPAEQMVISKHKEKREEKDSVFPAEGEINDYGFLHFRKAWLENLGWKKGMALKVAKNTDGSVTLRKP